MNSTNKKSFYFDKIQILIFHVANTRLGIDLEQISAICSPDDFNEQKLNVFPLHEKLKLKETNITYQSPKLIVLKDQRSLGIIIDSPQDITTLETSLIHPLPPLIEVFKKDTPVWGITIVNGKFVLLIDLRKIAHQ